MSLPHIGNHRQGRNIMVLGGVGTGTGAGTAVLLMLLRTMLHGPFYCRASAPAAASVPGAELKLVQVVFRHGDRAAERDTLRPPHAWQRGRGELSEVGRKQHYRLGQFFRARYIESGLLTLPNNDYNRSHVYVRSTDVDRTLMSAQVAAPAAVLLLHGVRLCGRPRCCEPPARSMVRACADGRGAASRPPRSMVRACADGRGAVQTVDTLGPRSVRVCCAAPRGLTTHPPTHPPGSVFVSRPPAGL